MSHVLALLLNLGVQCRDGLALLVHVGGQCRDGLALRVYSGVQSSDLVVDLMPSEAQRLEEVYTDEPRPTGCPSKAIEPIATNPEARLRSNTQRRSMAKRADIAPFRTVAAFCVDV